MSFFRKNICQKIIINESLLSFGSYFIILEPLYSVRIDKKLYILNNNIFLKMIYFFLFHCDIYFNFSFRRK